MSCFDDIDLSCKECYRVSRTNCDPFTIPAGLTPSDDVFLILVDKNGVQHTDEVTINTDGSLPVLPNNFGKVISKYGGEYSLVVSQTSTPVPVSMTISAMTYDCLLLDFTEKFCGCSQDFGGLINTHFEDGAVGIFPQQSVLGWDYISGDFPVIFNSGVNHYLNHATLGTPDDGIYRNTAFIPGGESYTLSVRVRDAQGQGSSQGYQISYDVWSGSLIGASGAFDALIADTSFHTYSKTLDLTSFPNGGYLQINSELTGAEEIYIDFFTLT